jgi:hypothetical protein
VLDLLEGVLSLGVSGHEPLLFWLLLMMLLLIMGTTATGLRNGNGNGATGATGNETGALGH